MTADTAKAQINKLRPGLVALGIGLLLALLAYWGGIDNLVHRWSTQDEYSHGFFLPLIAAWLLWRRRDAVLASFGRPSWFGVLLILVAIGMLVLGELTALFLLIQAGFLLTLVGLLLAAGGWPLLRVGLLPIALLIFAIPLPYFVDAQLSWRLQLLSSELGVDLLRLFGVSVYLEGNVIDLGLYQLQVVDACSGLRYLYPLLSVGFLGAYLFQAPLWQRVTVFLSTIPITIIMNSVRIALIGVLVNRWGTGKAEGFLHLFEGWVIFLVCALLLVGEIWLFARWTSGRGLYEVMYLPTINAAAQTGDNIERSRKPLWLALGLLAAAALFVNTLDDREELRPPREAFVKFPAILGHWVARDEYLPAIIEKKLGLDDYVLSDYRDAAGNTVNFYAAYYGSQRKGVSPHSPRVCMPGGGWLITRLEWGELEGLTGIPPFPYNRTVIERGEQRQLVYYWFEQRGRRIANEYFMKWYLLVDALTRNRTDGALVRVTTPLRADESLADGDARIRSFLQVAMPELHRFIPQ